MRRHTVSTSERIRRINQLHQDGLLSRIRAEAMLDNVRRADTR